MLEQANAQQVYINMILNTRENIINSLFIADLGRYFKFEKYILFEIGIAIPNNGDPFLMTNIV